MEKDLTRVYKVVEGIKFRKKQAEKLELKILLFYKQQELKREIT